MFYRRAIAVALMCFITAGCASVPVPNSTDGLGKSLIQTLVEKANKSKNTSSFESCEFYDDQSRSSCNEYLAKKLKEEKFSENETESRCAIKVVNYNDKEMFLGSYTDKKFCTDLANALKARKDIEQARQNI